MADHYKIAYTIMKRAIFNESIDRKRLKDMTNTIRSKTTEQLREMHKKIFGYSYEES